LNHIFLKLNGYGGMKGDLYRKYIASLIGGVQVGSGANSEDVVFNERDYSILISTRFNATWGKVMLGNWEFKEDDPERFLQPPELEKLEAGSPEEKDVLRRRVIMESIAKQFETRAFVVGVMGDDGTVYTLGCDLANAFRGAYAEGKLIIKTKHSDNSAAMIDDSGAIVPLVDLGILYVRETGQQDADGMPEVEELPFIDQDKGALFLTANLQTIREASQNLQGTVLKETPYTGNPSDLQVLKRCVYSAHDLLLRQC